MDERPTASPSWRAIARAQLVEFRIAGVDETPALSRVSQPKSNPDMLLALGGAGRGIEWTMNHTSTDSHIYAGGEAWYSIRSLDSCSSFLCLPFFSSMHSLIHKTSCPRIGQEADIYDDDYDEYLMWHSQSSYIMLRVEMVGECEVRGMLDFRRWTSN